MVVGDLGYRAVFVLVFFSAICLFIRRKWMLAVARREEIRRLLAMASEEAIRAELEASIEYAASSASAAAAAASAATAVPSTATADRYCVVCHTPTTSRCRRCKLVRYCSSKCQVAHWRQGHKHECSPPPIAPEIHDEGNKLASKSVKQNHHDKDFTSKRAEEESEYDTDSSVVLVQKLPKKDDMRSHDIPDGKSIPGPENSSVSASSAVPTSSSVHKTFNDNFVVEDEDLHDLDASEDGLPGMSHPVKDLDPFAVAKKLDSTYSSPFSASVVDLDHNVSESNSTIGESQCISTSASDSDENLLREPSAVSSGFWDGNLESILTNTSFQTSSGKTSYDKLTNGNASDSRPELSNHTFAGGPQTIKFVKEATFSGKGPMDSLRSSNSKLLTSEQQSISIDKGTSNGSYGTKPEGIKHLSSHASFDRSSRVEGHYAAADSLRDRAAINVSGRSKHVSAAMKESSQISTSEMVGKPHNVSEALSSSDANNHSTSAQKPIKAADYNRSVAHNQAQTIVPNASYGPKTSRLKANQSRSAKLSRYYSFGVGSGATAKSSEKGLFPYEMFVKLFNWKEVELRPFGLINCGNSCYANAVLQCLTFTPPLTAYLLQALHSKTCAKKDWCFTCEFEQLILAAKDRHAPSSPISILSHIKQIGSHLANGREEDAHEFMRYAIDTMQSICLQEAGVKGFKCVEEETTLLGLTFGGYLRSKIRCMRCRGKSEQHERMMDLTVEIEGDIDTLEEALQKFTSVEILDGANKYQCSRCKSYEKAKKRLTIFDAPNVLMIALKRFQAGKFGKLNKSIRFPDILDLAPYMRGSTDKLPIYRLYGVIVHLDIMNATFSGHYICYVRNAQNKWFKIDDSMVKAVEMECVLKEGAYMLFYSRYSPHAPRSVRESGIPRDILSKENFPEDKTFPGIDGKRGPRVGGGSSLHPSQVPPRSPNESGSRVRHFQEADSSSESCSIFSHSDEGTSITTHSNQESSTSTDGFFDRIFAEGMNDHYSYWRNPLDSDTSSSSSTSSSPLYTARPSPLSNSERYASAHSDTHSPIGGAGDTKGGGSGEVSVFAF